MNDVSERPVSGGYIYLAASGCPILKIPVESADMASAMFQQYRDRNGIGASDMMPHCGSIFADDGTLVANVSYNGRAGIRRAACSTNRQHPNLLLHRHVAELLNVGRVILLPECEDVTRHVRAIDTSTGVAHQNHPYSLHLNDEMRTR